VDIYMTKGDVQIIYLGYLFLMTLQVWLNHQKRMSMLYWEEQNIELCSSIYLTKW